jgi:hypothetical protein
MRPSSILSLAVPLTLGCGFRQPTPAVDDVTQGLSGTFKISAVATGKCIDVPGASDADGVLLHQWACHGRENQQWQVKSLGGGEHQLVSVAAASASTSRAATPRRVPPCSSGRVRDSNDNQRWKLTSAGGGAMRIQSVKSGRCLEVAGADNGAALVQGDCAADDNGFKFASVTGGNPGDPGNPGNPGNPPPDDGLTFRKANMTNFTSYPDPGSEECIKFNGCTWAGQFAALDGKQPLEWVKSHNIAAVHERDFNKYKLKTLRLKKGGKQIDVVVYDECADSDCDGCCTQNAKSTGFLIDIESFTADRFGVGDGVVDWTCLDCK